MNARAGTEGLVRRVNGFECAWSLLIRGHLRVASLRTIDNRRLCAAGQNHTAGHPSEGGIEVVGRPQAKKLGACSHGRVDATGPSTSESPGEDLFVKRHGRCLGICCAQRKTIAKGRHREHHGRAAKSTSNDDRRLWELYARHLCYLIGSC